MGKDVIVACDFASRQQTLDFLEQFAGETKKPFVKIGMELFYAEGPQIVGEIKGRGHQIFLDLKLHDIPNTVKKAMKVLSGLDVDLVNLHAAGTVAMMEAALEGLTRPDGTRPLLIAVTQLTSTDQRSMEEDLLIREPLAEVVMHYARRAKAAGLDGVVCSPLESAKVKEACGAGFLTVTPGVRFAGGDTGDQKRVMTPQEAKKIGSDYIVVGRPITGAEVKMVSVPRSTVWLEPPMSRLMELRAVMVMIPASRSRTPRRTWIRPVHSPAAAPARVAHTRVSQGFIPPMRSTVVTAAPRGKLLSTVRSGKSRTE